jgi:hypothetical protein
MKKLIAVAALAVLAVPALAGDWLSKGYRCDNACPLAQKANYCRSWGIEALAGSKLVRADLSQAVVANLARI